MALSSSKSSNGSSARMAMDAVFDGGWVARNWRTADLPRPTSSSTTTGGVAGFSYSNSHGGAGDGGNRDINFADHQPI